MRATVFLGGGRITSAIAAGLRLTGDQRQIIVYDRHLEKVRAMRRESRIVIARDLRAAIERAEMVVIAVRPGSVRDVLGEVLESGARIPPICVCLAAGIPLRNLRAWLPGTRWARAMPSPVCRSAQGLTAICFGRTVGEIDRTLVRKLFERVGQVVEIPEKQFDAFTVAYSSSHGYHALAALASAAQRAGLKRKTALLAAAHALADGVHYWRESGLSLDELVAEAATPGGTASATIAAMDRAGYRQAVERGLGAGIVQARRNARG